MFEGPKYASESGGGFFLLFIKQGKFSSSQKQI